MAVQVAASFATRTTSMSLPPFWKHCSAAKVIGASSHRLPNTRSNSAKLNTRTGRSTGPRRVRPTIAVIDVATPLIVRTPLGTSSM